MASRWLPGLSGPPRAPEVRFLIASFYWAVLATLFAVAVVAIGGGSPPSLSLVGPVWQWASTGDAGATPVAVPDPAAYTIRFERDGTFIALVDCGVLEGTYRVLLAGRAGGGANSLYVEPAGAAPSCGEASVAGAFVARLADARWYAIERSTLTVTLESRGTMTFEGPAAE